MKSKIVWTGDGHVVASQNVEDSAGDTVARFGLISILAKIV